jgi:hypothetical protein
MLDGYKTFAGKNAITARLFLDIFVKQATYAPPYSNTE